MSLWQTVRREAAGAVRSICYDLGLLRSRKGKPTRRLVIAAGVLTLLAAGGVGTAIAIGDALGGGERTGDRVASDDGGRSGGERDSPLSGINRATGSGKVAPSAGTPTPPAAPTPTDSPGRTREPEHRPTRDKSPTSDPTSRSPKPSDPPSDSPSPSCSASPSPDTDCSPSSSPVTSDSASPGDSPSATS